MIIEKSPTYTDKNMQNNFKDEKIIPIGSKVYITRDISLIKTAQNIIKDDDKPFYPPRCSNQMG